MISQNLQIILSPSLVHNSLVYKSFIHKNLFNHYTVSSVLLTCPFICPDFISLFVVKHFNILQKFFL